MWFESETLLQDISWCRLFNLLYQVTLMVIIWIFPCLFRTPLLQALIGLFELPEDDSIPDDEHFIDIEDTPGYQTAFSQLAFAGKKEHDPIGDAVGNPKILLAQSLHKLSTAFPGRVRLNTQEVIFRSNTQCVLTTEVTMTWFSFVWNKTTVNRIVFFLSPFIVAQVPSMLSTSLNAEALQYLQGYLQAASVQLLWNWCDEETTIRCRSSHSGLRSHSRPASAEL